MKFDNSFLNKFAAKWCKRFPTHQLYRVYFCDASHAYYRNLWSPRSLCQ